MSDKNGELKLGPALLGLAAVIFILLVLNTNIFDGSDGAVDEYEEHLIPAYEVVEIEEAHLPEARRYEYHVYVKEQAGTEELRHASRQLLERAKEELEFHGVVFSFYDREEYINRAQQTLGQALYAPYGQPDRVDEVQAGEYEVMEFSWSLRSKDWDQQLSDRDAEIWADWQDLYSELEAGDQIEDSDGAEKRADEEIAEKYDLEVEEVDRIREDFRNWSLMNLSN